MFGDLISVLVKPVPIIKQRMLENYLQHNYNVHMKKLIFEWDIKKAQRNFRKHGVSFEEAQSVFFDEMAVQFWDDNHSLREDRFLMLGLSNQVRVVLVVHCFRENEATIRIISARKATKKELKEYPGAWP